MNQQWHNIVFDMRADHMCGADYQQISVHWCPNARNGIRSWIISIGNRHLRLSGQELHDLQYVLNQMETVHQHRSVIDE